MSAFHVIVVVDVAIYGADAGSDKGGLANPRSVDLITYIESSYTGSVGSVASAHGADDGISTCLGRRSCFGFLNPLPYSSIVKSNSLVEQAFIVLNFASKSSGRRGRKAGCVKVLGAAEVRKADGVTKTRVMSSDVVGRFRIE